MDRNSEFIHIRRLMLGRWKTDQNSHALQQAFIICNNGYNFRPFEHLLLKKLFCNRRSPRDMELLSQYHRCRIKHVLFGPDRVDEFWSPDRPQSFCLCSSAKEALCGGERVTDWVLRISAVLLSTSGRQSQFIAIKNSSAFSTHPN